MKRAVYTAVFGNRETLRELPFMPSGEVGFFAFSDRDPLPTSETWTVCKAAPYWKGDDARSSRRIKLMGADVLQTFEQWLWVDNRVQLLREPQAIFDLLDTGPSLRMALHDHRATVADEFKAVLRDQRDATFHVKELLNVINLHYPTVLGEQPWSGGMILRRNTKEVEHFMTMWFSLVLRYSLRDQLSVNLARHLTNIQPAPLGFGLSGSPYHVWLTTREVRRNKTSNRVFFRLGLLDVLLELVRSSPPGYWLRVLTRATRSRLVRMLRVFGSHRLRGGMSN